MSRGAARSAVIASPREERAKQSRIGQSHTVHLPPMTRGPAAPPSLRARAQASAKQSRIGQGHTGRLPPVTRGAAAWIASAAPPPRNDGGQGGALAARP